MPICVSKYTYIYICTCCESDMSSFVARTCPQASMLNFVFDSDMYVYIYIYVIYTCTYFFYIHMCIYIYIL